MTEEDFSQSLIEAIGFKVRSDGPEYYFWEGYLRGLRRNYHGNIIDSEIEVMHEEEHNRFMVGDDLESLGYRAGFTGLTAQDALTVGKKGAHRAGLNRNFHKEGDLAEMGVLYQGVGKWTLPKGAKIGLDRKGRIESYYRSGTDWVLRLADGSEWIVWSEDIAGIDGPPFVNE